ncbi:MAG TPA: hypothetical protein PKB15_00705 [Acidimicrobiia bacterium]|nr:hypothetical protein [Acidimicrobiia bacterium]
MVPTQVSLGKSSHKNPKGRIRDAHQQVKVTLLIAFIFGILAVITTFINNDTGRWLPLHLFFTGTLLLAISGATQLFSVAWSAAQPPSQILVNTQRTFVIVGALGLGASRSLNWPSAFVASFGTILTLSIVVLMYLLHRIHKRAIQRRFRGVYFSYLIALSCGLLGTVFGSALVTGQVTSEYVGLRDAHLIVNLFGLVGLVISATLPSFIATQVRMKMSRLATPKMHLTITSAMMLGLLTCVIGTGLTRRNISIAGMAIYIGGIIAYIFMLPKISIKQIKWAGPRLFMILTGVFWWLAACVSFIVESASNNIIAGSYIVPMLVVGGYAQIFLGSIAYFGPIMTARNHEMRTTNLHITRAWPTYFAWNTIALCVVLKLPNFILWTAGVITAIDVLTRFAFMLRTTKVQHAIDQ